MRTLPTAWRTDEPCPTCGNDLTLVDDGEQVPRAECRMCGHAEPWQNSDGTGERDW